MTANPAPIALTQGDPAGCGPEITLKAWSTLRAGWPVFFLIGDMAVMARAARKARLPAPVEISSPSEAAGLFPDALPVLPAGVELPPVTPGQGDPAAAPLVRASIEQAVALSLSGEAAGLATNPISKAVMYAAGFTFPGHTEFVAELTSQAPLEGARGPVMMLACPGLRVALTSIHEPLSAAVAGLEAGRVAHVARVTQEALKRDFGLAAPRLALAGLNPHASEDGALGREEIETLNPVAAALRGEGVDISDARPPDTLFHAEAREGYDAAICLYHDQGLIPVKTLDFHGGVNITLGLPVVRTSPDHGVAYDIAGLGVARADSLIAALKTARDMADNRQGAPA